MKLTDKTKSIVHHILLYGPPKSGKTKLVGTLASKYKLIWFDLESGYKTLLQLPKESQENIELISLPDTPSFPVAIQTCLQVIKGTKTKICEAHGVNTCALCLKTQGAFTAVELNACDPSDTIVVFDSSTQLTASSICFVNKGQPVEYKMQTDDWGNVGKLNEAFYSHVQNAPFNIIVIAHDIDLAKKENDPKHVVPSAGSRNFSRNFAKFFDDVIYCEVKNGRHIAASSTLYSGGILTGSRTGIALENDKSGAVNLLDLFDPDRPKEEKLETPGSSSISALERIRANLHSAKGK
jgi:hypothetical protein